MDALGEPPAAVVVVLVVGVLLVNVFGFLAWRKDRVEDWYESAVFATFVPIAAATITGWMLLFILGVSSHLLLGLYGTFRWFRPR
jgi:uncharacterized membrane protein YfcA